MCSPCSRRCFGAVGCEHPQRARKTGLLDLRVHNLRDYTHDNYKTVDDRPFGGGPGMVLKCEPLFEALESLGAAEAWTVLMTPAGLAFNQASAAALAKRPRLLFICAAYEGIDERVNEAWVDEELSIGDYVLTNGALPAMVVIDAVTRLLPGALAMKKPGG